MEISPGNLIDQLSIINIKIFMLEDVKRNSANSDAIVAEATRKTNILNSQRNQFILAIDEAFNKIASGEKITISGQNTKIYSDSKVSESDKSESSPLHPKKDLIAYDAAHVRSLVANGVYPMFRRSGTGNLVKIKYNKDGLPVMAGKPLKINKK